MTININYLFVALISFILGSIPFALVYVKLLLGRDMRQFGSKNTGALNTLRIVSNDKGKTWGIISFFIVFLLDALKGVLAIIIAQAIIPDFLMATTLGIFFAILGHNYSLFLKFKGGRGAATLGGILFYLNPVIFFTSLLIILCFMFLVEILMGGRVSKKFLKNAVSDQIIGRVIGELFIIYWISIYNPSLIVPISLGVILVVIAHKDRIIDQINKIRNKTYFND